MKRRLTIISAAIFILTSCDGEKVQEAKKEGAEAVKATGEAAKEMTAKGMEKAKEIGKATADKLKSAAEAAKEAINGKKSSADAVKATINGNGSPALEKFKAKMGGLSEWFKSARGKAGEDPVKAHQMMGEMMTRVKSISGEGLPPDLKSAFERYQVAMTRVQEVSRSMPTDGPGAEAWYRDNADKLATLEKEVLGAFRNLKEAAANHGLTNLDLGGE